MKDVIRKILKEEVKSWRLQALKDKIGEMIDSWVEDPSYDLDFFERMDSSGFPPERIEEMFREKKEAVHGKWLRMIRSQIDAVGFVDQVWYDFLDVIPGHYGDMFEEAIIEIIKTIEEVDKINIQNISRARFLKLKKVKGTCYFHNCSDMELPELEWVGYLVIGGDCDLKELPRLKHVENGLDVSSTLIEELPELEYVGGDLFAKGAPLKSLPKLREVLGRLNLAYCKNIKSLPSIETVGRSCYFEHSGIYDIHQLKKGVRLLGNVCFTDDIF